MEIDTFLLWLFEFGLRNAIRNISFDSSGEILRITPWKTVYSSFFVFILKIVVVSSLNGFRSI